MAPRLAVFQLVSFCAAALSAGVGRSEAFGLHAAAYVGGEPGD